MDDTIKHISNVITNRGADVAQQTNIDNRSRGTVGERGQNIRQTHSNGPGWHVYGGAFHMLPEVWRIPSMTFLQFITMWLTGDQENSVPHVTA